MPITSPEIVELEVEPAIAPGLIVQLPAGKPFNVTVPVGTAQVGWIKEIRDGAAGTSFTVNV